MPTIRNIDAATLADWRRKGIIAPIAGERPTAAPGTWTLTILNWRPRYLNELMHVHYMTAHRRKKEDKKIIAVESIAQNIPQAMGRRRVSLRLILSGRDKEPDKDGCWKSVLDALVAARLLIDDSSKWCELGVVEFERGPRATVITLDHLIDA